MTRQEVEFFQKNRDKLQLIKEKIKTYTDQELAHLVKSKVSTVDPTLALALRLSIAEITKRQSEALRLYNPLPSLEGFHTSGTRTRLVIAGNRIGKTLAVCAEIARAATNQDPFGKYPPKDGRIYIIAKDLDHIGQIIWRKLGRPGAMRMIRDEHTGLWRTFRPWYRGDLLRQSQARPAPALLDKRFIADYAWENKSKGIPKLVKLTTGWEISFYSADAEPRVGVDLDLVVFDEEIPDERWYKEMNWRIIDRNGRIIWGCTPQLGTEQLYQLYQRAQEEQIRGALRRTVEVFHPKQEENTYLSEQAKKDAANDPTQTDEDRDVRVGGNFAFIGYRVYPEYSERIHGYALDFVPFEWTRYVVIDPGYQVCAVLIADVPPPDADRGDMILLSDELYLRNHNARQVAQALKERLTGRTVYEFIIDKHGSIRSDVGSGLSIYAQYQQAFKEVGLASVATGNAFTFGSADKKAGVLRVHGAMAVRENYGTPLLRVRSPVKDFLPCWEHEIKFYHKRRVKDVVYDEPDDRKDNHQMDSTRYLVMHEPKWVPPTAGGAHKPPLATAFKDLSAKFKKQFGQRESSPSFRLGPPGTPPRSYS